VDPKPEVIHRQIDETRESLAGKLETLEGQVKQTVSTVTGTIEGAKARVEDTVEAVKDSVRGTVEKVKETFSLSRQVERHPWEMMVGSFAAGVAAGYVLSGDRRPDFGAHPYAGAPRSPAQNLAAGYTSAAGAPAAETPHDGRRPSRGPGALSEMLRPFESELAKLKGVAIGALVALARDALKRSLPPALASHVDDIMNRAAQHAGGEPIREPLLPEQSDSSRPAGYGM
jgi:hypothetical protein